ncbi:MAG: amidase [Deltaproteobacteria bacterium]|nr:amidase [Deltaproteobacteria bacterium]
MSDELVRLDATGQAALVRNKEVTPLDLVDAAIARIEKTNPQLNAVITPLFEKARAQAKSPALPAGPFQGVPLVLKDLACATAGDPLHNGMRVLKEARHVAAYDTYLAVKFQAAGFICVGKTNTPELGLMPTTEPAAYGPTRNPWNLNHSTGGSSGGSAAAVAAGLVAVGHANDGGGSIRVPASECGLVGLKPSRGRVSLGPIAGEMWQGFAIEGVVTRSVRDTAGVLDAIAGYMPGDPYVALPPQRSYLSEVGRDPGKLRIGFMKRSPKGGAPLHVDCVTAVEETARVLASLGHLVEEAHPTALDEAEYLTHFGAVVTTHAYTALQEIGQMLGRELTQSDVEPWTWASANRGRSLSAGQYVAALGWLQAWSRRVAQWWASGFDVLLTPTMATPPPVLGELVATTDTVRTVAKKVYGLMQFTPQYNIAGQPAISLPLHWNTAGLPIGIQLVAALGREDILIQAAAQLEQARPWRDRVPPTYA